MRVAFDWMCGIGHAEILAQNSFPLPPASAAEETDLCLKKVVHLSPFATDASRNEGSL